MPKPRCGVAKQRQGPDGEPALGKGGSPAEEIRLTSPYPFEIPSRLLFLAALFPE